nr:hypothetical protein [Pleurocapsa sp. MO_226.B13]
MNSQDKPLEANENLDKSLDPSDVTKQDNENLVDLWTGEDEPETITEFVSDETATSNANTPEDAVSEVSKKPAKKKKLTDIDFDNWDFRDPIPPEPTEEIEPNIVRENQSKSEELELDPDPELKKTSEESNLEEISLDSEDSELDELGEFESLVSLTEETPEKSNLEEISLDSEDSELDELGEFESLVALTEETPEENNLEEINLD